MCTKPHICGKLRKLLHISLPPPQVLNIDLGKTLYIYIDHEQILSVDSLSFYLEQDKELQNTVWQQSRNYSSHSFITVSWWIPAVTFLFYFGWFTHCHMSGTFKWRFGAWLINLQDATWFEELELHNLEFCVSQKTGHSMQADRENASPCWGALVKKEVWLFYLSLSFFIFLSCLKSVASAECLQSFSELGSRTAACFLGIPVCELSGKLTVTRDSWHWQLGRLQAGTGHHCRPPLGL